LNAKLKNVFLLMATELVFAMFVSRLDSHEAQIMVTGEQRSDSPAAVDHAGVVLDAKTIGHFQCRGG
jgi:hypothetical protein